MPSEYEVYMYPATLGRAILPVIKCREGGIPRWLFTELIQRPDLGPELEVEVNYRSFGEKGQKTSTADRVLKHLIEQRKVRVVDDHVVAR